MYILDQQDVVAAGGERLLFIHPESRDFLIKVLNTKHAGSRRTVRGFLRGFSRLPLYGFYISELVEYVALREKSAPCMHFLQQTLGVVDTNLGLGLVVAAVRDRNGGMAMSLEKIIKNGLFSPKHRAALDELLAWIESTYVILHDLRPCNVVWNEIDEHFVVIDGIGSKGRPSLRTFSETYNRRSNRKRVAGLRARVQRQLVAVASKR